ncbi:hypothetical protein GCM10010168_06070 [Actinoplanes ianthinogenes]|uniref:Uncharacterized protein n=1 Tax=Actinoplanes ianthinogenes TaxID=122358 RepID=A0ABM7LTM7_9ACTN|nr:hypothetical protein [Actinoplanes ianthinogenes]BCJ42651.1 hypothetical protein Aiant_33080 [Actinoplanes ianthinogenes]GGQ93173.1 hypothetical protein GCM10010168_06070 [Actinoplanes ianthinogenes]
MGLDYAYEIHLPATRVRRALEAVVDLAPPGEKAATPVLLPGGARLTVPFTSNFRGDPVDCSDGRTLNLDTSLMFEVGDDEIREFLDEPGGDRAAIGYIYLTVFFEGGRRPGYAKLDFTAATTGMSLLFERSPSVRRLFTGLAEEAGAACCLLDKEHNGYEVCWTDGTDPTGFLPPDHA